MNRILSRILGRFDEKAIEQNLSTLKADMPPIFTFELPENMENSFMDYMMERSYLEDVSERDDFISVPLSKAKISWLKINRLPVSPLQMENYDMLSRWQSVLSSLHSWGNKLIFLLERNDGRTNLYVGIQHKGIEKASEECYNAFITSMPGIDLEEVNQQQQVDIISRLHDRNSAGAITGIPTFRKETKYGILQTLDKMAFGIHGVDGRESIDYSLLVIAEPIRDDIISETIAKYQDLGSRIHTDVRRTRTQSQQLTYQEGTQTSYSAGMSVGGGNGIGSLVKSLVEMNPPKILMNLVLGGISFNCNVSRSYTSSHSVSYSESVAEEFLNKFAQYSENLTDKHCERLRLGRSMGFWNTGVYVLGQLDSDIDVITGILRSIYSGEESYIEPIRIHKFHSLNAIETIRRFNLVPLRSNKLDKGNGTSDWHPLGKLYQSVSTPVNTLELSLFASLPRKDVPGLRFVKNVARFANNPGKLHSDGLEIGKIVDTGIVLNNAYTIDIDSLVRHSLITGSTGSGKTTTSKAIIDKVLSKNIPVLIIEPAKDEWVRWAIQKNQTLPLENQIRMFMPGVKRFEGSTLPPLSLNPFQPAAWGDSKIDMQTRCEQITALINKSLPTGDILPVIIDEAIYTYLSENINYFEDDDISQLKKYPRLEGVMEVAKEILKKRRYEMRVGENLTAALETRFKYLTRGKRGSVLNQEISTNFSALFDHTCIVNLSKIGNDKDLALIMSMLLLSLQEYRKSQYLNSNAYRDEARRNRLMHLTVIEEAHNVMQAATYTSEYTGNPQQSTSELFSKMLSETRSIGEGMMIIDQIPTRLISDVIRNTNYKICHRLSSIEDCSVMGKAMALRNEQEAIIPLLEVGDAIVMSDQDDGASWIKINN
ncbi:MAG: hypothetical protein F082_1147 [bacterium F082]|nr:MAG: hypothetical protein F082_1147 [bacterium F082]KWW28502.1 MAG: hypothetical protein AUK64_1641 [bacterium P201]